MFNRDWPKVFYLFDCVVCGFEYVSSTRTPFTLRLNNYNECYCKFKLGSSLHQINHFGHFTEKGHYGCLEDIPVKSIDRLVERDWIREGFPAT